VPRPDPAIPPCNNRLKRSFEGGDSDAYVAAEQEFIEDLLRS
jgi:hypothetical protein